MNLPDKLTEGLRQTLHQIEQAARRQDIPAVQNLTQKATVLRSLGEQLSALEKQIEAALSPSTSPENATDGLRKLPVQVTAGMIRQNLLTLTEHVKHGRIQIGEILEIEVRPSGERFTTELLEQSNKLQERGAIGRFYRDARISEGDIAVLLETSPRQWILQKGQPFEWDGHYRYKRTSGVPVSLTTSI